MDWRNYVDVSSSILFEATADSEADSDINKNMDHALLSEDMGLGDDDALSCSCDDIDFKDFDHEFDLVDEDEGLEDDYRNFDDDDDDENDDLEDGVVDQFWNGDHEAKDLKSTRGGADSSPGVLMDERQRKKLKVCADSIKEFMNQRDKDRLFWETCLAS